MKQKIFIIMALLTTLLGCGNKISGPDFEHQENKVIVLNDMIRVDYQIPGNLSQFMGFKEKYNKQPKSIDIKNLDSLDFISKDWKNFYNADGAMWEYYRGKRNIEKNKAAEFSIDIDVHKHDNHSKDISTLKISLQNRYNEYLNGEIGINTKTRARHPDLSDDDLGPLVVPHPIFNIINIQDTDFVHWSIYGELKGWNLEYYSTPITNDYYLTILFSYYYVANNEKEFEKIEKLVKNDIKKFINQIHISNL